MAISNLPAAPARSDTPTNFISKADTFIASLATFVTEANSTAAAMNLNDTNDNSTSSILIGLGAKTFVVSTAKSFQPGMFLVIASTAAPSTNSMSVQVTSYSGTSLVVNCLAFIGSGTIASWKISQSVSFTPQDNSVSPVKLSTGGPTWTSAGELTVVLPSLLGYGTGAGGAVTQITSKTTAVTLNKPTGQVTTSSSALAAGAKAIFLLNNTLIGVADLVSVNVLGAAGSYRVVVANIGATGGSVSIELTNVTAGALSEAVVISFGIMKGAIA